MAKINLTKSAVDAAQATAQIIELPRHSSARLPMQDYPSGAQSEVFMLQHRTNVGASSITVEQARSLAQE